MNLDFIASRSTQRTTKIRRMLRELGLAGTSEGRHVMSADFIGEGNEDYYANLHVDEIQLAKTKKTLDYFVQLSLIKRPGTRPPKVLRDRKKKLSWMFAELEALRDAHTFCMIDVEASTTKASLQPVAAVPLTIGGRPLPLIGAEYGGEQPKLGEVRHFRWSTKSEGTTRVWVSYLWELNESNAIAASWERHGKVAEKYIEEAFRQ